MKFTRRPDLDPHTRIDIVKLTWLYQGIYGKMTQIAQDYHISRTFLYQIFWAHSIWKYSLAIPSSWSKTIIPTWTNCSCCYVWKDNARFRVCPRS